MDPNLPTTPGILQPERSFKPSLMLVAAIASILTIAASATYYLNRQKIQDITTPQQTAKKELVFARKLLPTVAVAESIQKGPYRCPTANAFCQNKSSYKESSLSGKLTGGSPLYAAFDGNLSGMSALHPEENGKGEEFNLIVLTNPSRGLEAMYYFKGEIGPKKEAREGEIIATVSGQPVNFMGGNSFIFTLIQATEKGGQLAPLSPASFKQ